MPKPEKITASYPTFMICKADGFCMNHKRICPNQ